MSTFLLFLFIFKNIYVTLSNQLPPMPVTTPDDNPPDECLDPLHPYKIDKFAVECMENFDCQACKYMECHDCFYVNCNGDGSCYRVNNITVNGVDYHKGGCEIICAGDESCQYTKWDGTNIKGFTCGGDESCKGSKVKVDCITKDIFERARGCLIECGGDSSCQFATISAQNVRLLGCSGVEACLKATIDIDGVYGRPGTGLSAGCESPKSCLNANIKATNVHEFSCGGGSACENATIRIAGERYKGVGFSCGSGEACYNASIIVKKTGSFSCGGGKACLDSNIYIEPLDEGFVLSCGSAGCRHARVHIELTNNLGFKGIHCGSPRACQDFELTAYSPIPVEIEELLCEDMNACRNATFTLTNIKIKKTVCFGPGACKDKNVNEINQTKSFI